MFKSAKITELTKVNSPLGELLQVFVTAEISSGEKDARTVKIELNQDEIKTFKAENPDIADDGFMLALVTDALRKEYLVWIRQNQIVNEKTSAVETESIISELGTDTITSLEATWKNESIKSRAI
jgi:hypothetical protein